MAVTRVVTVSYTDSGAHLGAAGANSVVNVEIPSGSQFALIFFGYYEGAGNNAPTSVVLNSQSATHIRSENTNTANLYGSVYYAPTPSSGTNLTCSWSCPVSTTFISLSIVFFSGGDTTSGTASLVRDSDGANGATSATTPSITAQSGDLVVAFITSDGTTSSVSPGSITVDHSAGSPDNYMVEYSPSGATTMGVSSATNPAIIGIALIPSGGGGGAYNAVPVLEYHQSLRRGGVFH